MYGKTRTVPRERYHILYLRYYYYTEQYIIVRYIGRKRDNNVIVPGRKCQVAKSSHDRRGRRLCYRLCIIGTRAECRRVCEGGRGTSLELSANASAVSWHAAPFPPWAYPSKKKLSRSTHTLQRQRYESKIRLEARYVLFTWTKLYMFWYNIIITYLVITIL